MKNFAYYLFVGAGLFQCYFNNPGLTNRVLVTINNEKFFKSGDLARYNSFGELVHIGRGDFRIKINGQQVEQGEVESILLQIVSDCIVVKATHLDNDFLVAYVRTTHTAQDLRQHCLSRLPRYMVPSLFMIVDKIPFNQNGKVDRHALPPPDFSSLFLSTSTAEQLRTDMEKQVYEIWCQVLPYLSCVSTSTSFFELGGNSIAMMKLSYLYQTVLKRKVDVINLFHQPTIIDHALLLEQQTKFEHNSLVWQSLNLIKGMHFYRCN